MRKRLVEISAILATLAFSSAAFAATAEITTSTTIGGGIFSPSKSVTLKVNSSGTSYAASSQHGQGTKQYATVGGTGVTGDPTKIMVSDAIATGPSAVDTATALPSTVTWTDH